jgi:hydroxyacyl-ACP dehydratase HTD2-like protein with hotdog domain
MGERQPRGRVGMSDGSQPPAHFREIERSWRPEAVVAEDEVGTLAPAAFAALLDQPSAVDGPGSPLPPLWHWLLFPEVIPSAALGADGHPRQSALVPPLPNRRRVFGGGRVRWHGALRCGQRVRRVSQVSDVRTRVGATGPLLIVTVVHELSADGRVALVEAQDLVYRDASDVADASAAPTAGTAEQEAADGRDVHRWSLSITPDPVLLFRFSALTWNAHRIHYDRTYATEVEGHRDLVVHGPLLALLLLEVPRRRLPRARVTDLAWRMHRPVHVDQQVLIRADEPTDAGEVTVRAGVPGEPDAVTATVTVAEP